MASSAHKLDKLYEQLLTINRQMFADGAFEVAYHTLAAAMWRAWDLRDMSLLRALLEEVGRQKEHIDSTYPAHRLSSFTAHEHGHESIYSALQLEISSHIQVYEAQRMLEEQQKQRG